MHGSILARAAVYSSVTMGENRGRGKQHGPAKGNHQGTSKKARERKCQGRTSLEDVAGRTWKVSPTCVQQQFDDFSNTPNRDSELEPERDSNACASKIATAREQESERERENVPMHSKV